MGISRRQFLGTSAAAVLVAGTMARGKVFGANERVRVGVVGINGRGGDHIRGLHTCENAEVAALCDCDRNVLESRVAAFENAAGKRPKAYVDMRELFADADIDAVSFATPNHWHALGTVWACEAGKDVFVEKPISHNVYEGRQAVAAAERYNRIVMHGTQSRSSHEWIRAFERMRAGVIGDIYMARALCYKRRDSIGFQPDSAPPEHLDWTLWQGPAQDRPFNANYVHYNWHWFWDFGNGDLGNQGVHQMDVAVWGIDNGLPSKVFSTGGRYTYNDQGETPNTQVATFTYPDGRLLVFEVRGRATNDEAGAKVGNLFYGTGGYMVDRRFYDTEGKEIPDSGAGGGDRGTGNHYQNFVNAVRSRDQAEVRGTALDAHIGCAHIHIANIAYRLGTSLTFDPAQERFVGNAEADQMLSRGYRPGFEVPKLA